MRSVLKSGFLWQFVGGFTVAAIALVSLHPVEAPHGAAPTQVVATK